MTGEALGYALEQLLSEGALDAWFTSIQMKKNRPAVLLTILCREDERERFCQLLLVHTSTLGVRWQSFTRCIAERAVDLVTTPYGSIRRKQKLLDGKVVSIKPEYEDCARLAQEQHLPLQVIIDAARGIPVGLPDSKEGALNE